MAGQAAVLAAGVVMEKQATAVPRVGRPFRRGLSGLLWRSAQVLTAASLVLRKKSVAAGALGLAGSLLLRFAVEHAGAASVRDPRASFHLQRSVTEARP